jgi:8-oxo-dGTP diphosphatase
MEKETPVFGTQTEGKLYFRRPSAYALVRNALGQWAVVRTPQGCYLPGGGMEPHETPQETVIREAREECGFILKPGATTARAIQFCYSEEERKHFEKICEFMDAELIDTVAPTEHDHELVWMGLEQALEALLHEAHRWAVEVAELRRVSA